MFNERLMPVPGVIIIEIIVLSKHTITLLSSDSYYSFLIQGAIQIVQEKLKEVEKIMI